MRLTIEQDGESIKRYAHIKPGRTWKGPLCGARCPGSTRTCTLDRKHRGPHVAHSVFRKVVAVWDRGGEVRRSGTGARTVTPRAKGEVWTGGVGGPLEALWRRLAALVPAVGDIALLVMFLGFVAAAVYWATLIF